MSIPENPDPLPSRDVLNDAHEVFMGSSTKTARIQARLMAEVCRDFMVKHYSLQTSLFISTQAPLLAPPNIRNTATDTQFRLQVDQVANKLMQWVEHLRSTTDFVVPDEINRILDIAPRVKVIFKNLSNADLVNRIVNQPEPSAQAAADDDAVRVIRSPFSRHITLQQVSLGPEDIPSDDDDEPAIVTEPVEQDVTMTDISPVSFTLIRLTLLIPFCRRTRRKSSKSWKMNLRTTTLLPLNNRRSRMIANSYVVSVPLRCLVNKHTAILQERQERQDR
jgi:hypothetical protein